MSNRVLNSMIENRFQQVILGIYIGTIVYALFLLSTIRDISSGIYVPAFSIYLLILLTVIDIFLFIYFLDYVTQTVKYETVFTWAQFDSWLAKIEAAELTALDTETTSLDAFAARLVGISLSVTPGEACYIPLAHTAPGVPDQLPLEEGKSCSLTSSREP